MTQEEKDTIQPIHNGMLQYDTSFGSVGSIIKIPQRQCTVYSFPWFTRRSSRAPARHRGDDPEEGPFDFAARKTKVKEGGDKTPPAYSCGPKRWMDPLLQTTREKKKQKVL